VTDLRRERVHRLHRQLGTATMVVRTGAKTKSSVHDAATLRTLDQHVVNL
jgi:hypothetical protein